MIPKETVEIWPMDVISGPAWLMSPKGGLAADFDDATIYLTDHNLTAKRCVRTVPEVRTFRSSGYQEDDKLFLVFRDLADIYVPVERSGRFLMIRGLPQTLCDGLWKEATWEDLRALAVQYLRLQPKVPEFMVGGDGIEPSTSCL